MIQVIDRVFNILEHLRDSQVLSLSCLAKRMGLNKSTLCNILKTMTDLGYVENDGSGNYRISEISYMVGFSSPSYFAKCFQKQFGVKPMDFVAAES